MKTFEGQLLAGSGRYAIVVSRFNDLVTRRLLEGALDTIRRHGGNVDHVDVAWVPGSFELPLAASRLARSGRYVAVICLGAVIQGETTHHEYINHQVAAGLQQTMLAAGVPVTFGVLTCGSLEQALERAGGESRKQGV